MKVLLIDAEPAFTQPLIDLLVINGIKSEDIIYRHSVAGAFNELQRGDIGCICMEMLLPDPMKRLVGNSELNGLNLLSMLRKEHNMPVIAYTILDKTDGKVKVNVEKLNATYVGKTEAKGVENVIKFIQGVYNG